MYVQDVGDEERQPADDEHACGRGRRSGGPARGPGRAGPVGARGGGGAGGPGPGSLAAAPPRHQCTRPKALSRSPSFISVEGAVRGEVVGVGGWGEGSSLPL